MEDLLFLYKCVSTEASCQKGPGSGNCVCSRSKAKLQAVKAVTTVAFCSSHPGTEVVPFDQGVLLMFP